MGIPKNITKMNLIKESCLNYRNFSQKTECQAKSFNVLPSNTFIQIIYVCIMCNIKPLENIFYFK